MGIRSEEIMAMEEGKKVSVEHEPNEEVPSLNDIDEQIEEKEQK